MSKPRVSVLVDTYNHEQFIEQALVGVLAQDVSAADVEVIVVDDGSTDNTPAIVAKFAPRVRYLGKANGGQATAFNFGIAATRGEIVAFLDADDWWEKAKLRRVLETFEKNPNLGVVGHAIWEVHSGNGTVKVICPEKERVLELSTREEALLFRQWKCLLGTSRLAIRKEVLMHVLPIPAGLVVEADEFMFTLAAAISGAIILEQPLTYYRLHANNLFQFSSRDETKIRRKRDVLYCLGRELPARLSTVGVPPATLEAIMEPIWVEGGRLSLILGEGKPLDTFRIERAAYRLRREHEPATLADRAFNALALGGALLMPPRMFYRSKDWYAARDLGRLRRLWKQRAPASPPLKGQSEA